MPQGLSFECPWNSHPMPYQSRGAYTDIGSYANTNSAITVPYKNLKKNIHSPSDQLLCMHCFVNAMCMQYIYRSFMYTYMYMKCVCNAYLIIRIRYALYTPYMHHINNA